MKAPAVALALLLLTAACGSAARHRSSQEPGPECGRGVSGPGFDVFACMSGGARAGHPHPKELLVVRTDGVAVPYPAFRIGMPAAGDGEVVAVYDDTLVRVTGRRLVPLVTREDLARAIHRRSFLIMGFGDLDVDARGDVRFSVSTLIRGRHGCQKRSLERLAGGGLRQLRASSAPPNDVCS